MRTVAIIQARMASSRLPGKVLLEIGGRPMLQWVVERVRQAEQVDQVVVATTVEASDDPVADFCEAAAVACFRGSHHDVLDRFYRAALAYEADLVVRVTADCPLLDPGLLDRTLLSLWEPGNHPDSAPPDYDFAANRLPPPWGRTYPIGLDVEACTFTALETAWRDARSQHQREHVMPYLYEESGRFRVNLIHHEQDFGDRRWTVDTPEDLAALRALVKLLPSNFNWLDVLAVWESHPEISGLNAGVKHKTAHDIDERIV